MAKTILLADDSATIRKIVELAFGGSEIRVDAVGSGAEAMERFEAAPPDLVLADVVMPEPAGYEFCRIVKRSAHPVPVMLLAGAFEPYDEELARACEADDHLVKPFESRALIEKVDRLLHGRVPLRAPVEVPVEVPVETAPAHERNERIDDEVDALAEEVQEAVADGPPEELYPDRETILEGFSPEDIEAIARRVVRHLSEDLVRDIVRELVPDLAAQLIRDRIRELEGED